MQFLNLNDQYYGLNVRQLKHTIGSRRRYYYEGDKEHDQVRSEKLKDLLKQLWAGVKYTDNKLVTLLVNICGTSMCLWYVTLESKIFNDEPSKIQPRVEQSTESLAHVHEDGTFV